MVKYQFNKNWSWINDLETSTDLTDKQIDYVYRIDANPCVLGACKTNCSTNPYCLNGLGEKKLVNLIQKETNLTVERNDYFRSLDEYAGLRNLGATCYINTYLQVWFNNIFFREYILQIPFDKVTINENEKAVESPKVEGPKKVNDIIPPFQVDQFQCIGKNLQLIFSLMKESIRRSLDPNFFIKALGLDENMQQDAQEFSQLFLTTLQNSLFKLNLSSGFEEQHMKFFQSNTKNNIINDLFKGQYSYITECNSCRLQSVRNSDFIELTLNIQNSNTIIDCMNELLKEEIMDGDNQYYCDNCARKSNAKRMTKLDSLPPVLNLQLLRFVYDRNSGYKKKLSTKIKFSELLDLKSFSETNKQEESVYSLGAILMHVGKTAYSGHYMAQIKNFQTNKWYQFNDEIITELKKKQQLGCTEEESDKQTNTEETNTKTKTFSTSNAYLLVYYRSDLVAQNKQIDISKTSNQNEIISQDNINLECWFDELKSNKLNQFESKNAERETMNSIYNSLWLDKTDKKSTDAYFISTEFLKRLLTHQNSISANDILTTCSIQKYICQHKRLNPMVVTKLKVISKLGYDNIIQIYGAKINDLSTLFLKANDYQTTKCKECITNCFEYLKCKERLKNDMKTVRSILRTEPLIDDISKISSNSNELDFKNLVLNNKSQLNDDKNYKKIKSTKPENDDCMLIENDNVTNSDEQAASNRATISRSISSEMSPSISKSPDSSISQDSISENKENSNFSTQPTLYWIGKETLKIWQSLALKRFESQLPTAKSNEDIDEQPINQDTDIKVLEKDGIEIIEPIKQENSNDNKDQLNENDIAQTDSQSLSFFNEDIICPHGSLLPGQQKRLISFKVWSIVFEKYFSNDLSNEKAMKIFTNESRECKTCLKLIEEAATRNNQVKIQKDNLNDLFTNKQRPVLSNLVLNTEYYLIQTDFIKEWRTMVRQTKFKDIKIYNESVLCPHDCLPFNENTIDYSMVSVVTDKEWKVLSDNFTFDKIITVIKTSTNEIEMNSDAENKTEIEPVYSYIFEPSICEFCLEKNELDKYLFENKKIFIRLIDDELPKTSNGDTPKANGNNDEAKNYDIIEIAPISSKKARLCDIEMEEHSPKSTEIKSIPDIKASIRSTSNLASKATLTLSSNASVSSSNLTGTRRSKRARKCKGDYEITASSYDTIKKVKIKICSQISRMISEQHIFFHGNELDNDKTLAEYKINPTDTLLLKIDKVLNDEFEGHCYENAHLPEIGFKGIIFALCIEVLNEY